MFRPKPKKVLVLHFNMENASRIEHYFIKKYPERRVELYNLDILAKRFQPASNDQDTYNQDIYIFAHGEKNNYQQILDDDTGALCIDQLVTTLEKVILKNCLQQCTGNNYFERGALTLNLIMCYGAYSDKGLLDSFAARLQRALAENDIYVNVKARNRVSVISYSQNQKFTVRIEDEAKYDALNKKSPLLKKRRTNLNDFVKNEEEIYNLRRHHEAGSKFTFSWQKRDGKLEQVVNDSYFLKEQQKTIEKLKMQINQLGRLKADIGKVKGLSQHNQDKITSTIEFTTLQLINAINNFEKGKGDIHTAKELQDYIKTRLMHARKSLEVYKPQSDQPTGLLFAMRSLFSPSHPVTKTISTIDAITAIADSMNVGPATGDDRVPRSSSL